MVQLHHQVIFRTRIAMKTANIKMQMVRVHFWECNAKTGKVFELLKDLIFDEDI